MGKGRVLLIAVSVVSAITIGAFVLGVGPFAQDTVAESPDRNSENGTDESKTVTDSGFEVTADEPPNRENMTAEEIREQYEERYTGPGDAPEFYNDMESLNEYPPGIHEQLEVDKMIQETVQEMREHSYAFNLYQLDTTTQQGMISYVGSKYNAQLDRGLHRIVRAGDSQTRFYSSRNGAIEQQIPLRRNKSELKSTNQLTAKDYFRSDLVNSFIEPGVWEPTGWTEVNGNTVVVLQTDFIAQPGRQSLANSMGDYVDEIKLYGGELYVGESGALLEAQITVVYENRFGDEEGRTFRTETVFGDTNVTQPNWAEKDVLEQPTSDPIALVDNRYFQIQPQDDDIPAETSVRVMTSTSQYNITIPGIETGDVGFIYLKNGELVYGKSEPETNEYIGFEYSILLIDQEGRLLLSKESE
jgi:hypothetical protein